MYLKHLSGRNVLKAFTLNEIRQKRANCIQIRLDPTHSTKTLSQDLKNV